MAGHGRGGAVVSLLLALILGIAGTSNGEVEGDLIGSANVAEVFGAGSGLEGVAHPGPAGGLEPEPTSERELDDDPSSAAMPSWTDASRLGASQRIWSREESGANPIHSGANRSRAPPHAPPHA
jgi:hypothetical protein